VTNILRITGVSLVILGIFLALASIGNTVDQPDWGAAISFGIFALVLLIVGVVCLYLSYRRNVSFKPSTTTIVREREVVKEVVMVHCRYCGGLMPELSAFCPNCGARRQ
jgi:uncharacterized protein YjeT (DUF2065 family)